MHFVIGGGVVGLCAAYELERRGYNVQVVEPNEIGSGSSFGMTRAFRPPYPCGYDSAIFPAAEQAYAALSSRFKATFIEKCPCIEFGEAGSQKYANMRRILSTVRPPTQQILGDYLVSSSVLSVSAAPRDLSPQEITHIFPENSVTFETALIRHDCGVISASLLIETLRQYLYQKGVTFISKKVALWQELSSGVSIHFTDGSSETGDSILLATGCWTGELYQPPNVQLWNTEESVFTFSANPAFDMTSIPQLISFIGQLNGGFAVTVEGNFVKIIERTGGPKVTMGERSYTPREDAQIRCKAFLSALCPSINWKLTDARTCCYEWTSDYIPIAGQIGRNAWIIGCFTGGGFKLAPLFASMVTDAMTTGAVPALLEPFSPLRK